MVVKVFKRKQLLVDVAVYKPTRLALNQSNYGDKFVIKVESAFDFEAIQPLRLGVSAHHDMNIIYISMMHIKWFLNFIQIVASTSARFSHLPELPNNTSVEEIALGRSCQSSWIAWLDAPDDRSIRST